LNKGKSRQDAKTPSKDQEKKERNAMRMRSGGSRFPFFFAFSFLGLLGVSTVPLLRGSEEAESPSAKLLLIGSGPDGHPAQTHEYMAGLKVLAKCLKDVPGLDITTVCADEPWKEGPELIARADGVVLYLSEGARWMNHDPKRHEALATMAARGGGITVLHWAMGTKDAKYIDGCLQLLGGCHGGPDRKYKVLETNATITDRNHPITTSIKDFHVRDEFYYRLKFIKDDKDIHPLVRVSIDNQPETVAWCWERPDRGRSFGFSGLHYHDNWRLTEYRRLVAQGVLWTLKKPIPKDGLLVTVSEEDLKLK
jgi:type 1 glutamine amidotransferase